MPYSCFEDVQVIYISNTPFPGSKVGLLLWWVVLTIYYCFESLVLLIVPKKYRSKDVRGNVVLVTGGGSGIGRLMCLKFAAKGALVVTWDVSETSE